jgi:hypothetical protein
MFDRLRTGQLDRWSRADYQAKRWKRRFPMYGNRFALAGLAILFVLSLFANRLNNERTLKGIPFTARNL